MQSIVALAEAAAARLTAYAFCCGLTFSFLPALKKGVRNSSRKAIRSLATSPIIPAMKASSMPPSGLSSDLSRNGGTAEARTTLLTRSAPNVLR